MSANLIVTQLLVVALALVMFGLGLSLAVQDFTRLLKPPKAVAPALALQIILNNFQLALSAAIYSVSMYITATLFGLLALRSTKVGLA